MPAIVGAVNVNSVGSAGVFNIGDVHTISPYNAAKTFSGAGSFNTGEYLRINNEYSNTNTYDRDLVDQPTIGNL